MDGCLDVCGPRGTSAFMQPPGQAERISSAGRVPMSLSCVTVCAMGVVELAKGDCELDKFKARSWVGRHRHVTWSVFALAVVAGIRAKAARSASGRARQKSESYCFKWCGRSFPTPSKCWPGWCGDDGTRTCPQQPLSKYMIEDIFVKVVEIGQLRTAHRLTQGTQTGSRTSVSDTGRR